MKMRDYQYRILELDNKYLYFWIAWNAESLSTLGMALIGDIEGQFSSKL
jgi:hypothetical protein